MLGGAAPAPTAELEIAIDELRSAKGAIRLCLTRDEAYFPDCKADPRAIRHSAPAGEARLSLSGLAPGAYAMSVIHDENGNGKLDKFGFVPREGFGFSRNPKIRFGPPSFKAVRFTIAAGRSSTRVRINYLL